MLTAINLDHQLQPVAGKIGDVGSNLYLPAEVRASQRQMMTQMPPQFALGPRRPLAHSTCKHTLLRHHCPIRERPGAFVVFVVHSHHYTDPHP
jgi:hypothetical protein